MRKNNFTRNIFTTVFIGITFCGNAQFLPCGNGRIDTIALNKALQYERSLHRDQTVTYLVRVYFHVFRNDDGTQAAATTTEINNEFTSLLASYASDNVCFLFCGVEFINSTNLNQNFNADSDPNGTALNPYQGPHCINVFYMRKINANNTAGRLPRDSGGVQLGGS